MLSTRWTECDNAMVTRARKHTVQVLVPYPIVASFRIAFVPASARRSACLTRPPNFWTQDFNSAFLASRER